jgi:N4-gp56 family major capsid protein
MSWTFDAPSGTYRNHALSSNIRMEAIADTQFMKFFQAEPGYGKGKGQGVTITRIGTLPLASRVGELDRLPSGRPAITTKTVNVSQWGFKIPVTEFEKNLTHFNIMDPLQQRLRDQISLTMDVMCAEVFTGNAARGTLGTPIKYVPMSTGQNIDTDGSPTGVSDRNLGVQDLRRIHDLLRGLKVPYYRNGRYVGILSTRAARGIKNDPEYKDWQAPTTSAPFLTGALKDIEGFILYETNHADALADLVGTSTTTGEAVFFGADAGRLVSLMDPEIRMGIPEELGLFRDVGWVADVEGFLPWETASVARVVHVTSN